MKQFVKQFLALLMVVAMFSMVGCSGTAAKLAEQKQWESYYAAKMAQINKPQQKQFDVNVADDGKFQGVTIYAVAPTVQVDRPKKDFHPAWTIGGNILQAAVPYLGVIGTAKVVSDGMVDLAKSTQGPVTTNTYTDSYNTAGQDYAGGDMSNAVSGDTITAGQDYAGGDMSNLANADSYNSSADISNADSYNPFTDSNNPVETATTTDDNSVTYAPPVTP